MSTLPQTNGANGAGRIFLTKKRYEGEWHVGEYRLNMFEYVVANILVALEKRGVVCSVVMRAGALYYQS